MTRRHSNNSCVYCATPGEESVEAFLDVRTRNSYGYGFRGDQSPSDSIYAV